MLDTKGYLSSIVSGLVNRPEAVIIAETTDELGVLLTVSVDQADLGRIIGKGGDVIQAIRKVVHVHGMQHKTKVSVKVADSR